MTVPRPPRSRLPLWSAQTDAQTPMKSPLLVGLETRGGGGRFKPVRPAAQPSLCCFPPSFLPSSIYYLPPFPLSPSLYISLHHLNVTTCTPLPFPQHTHARTHTYFPLLSPLLPSLSLLSLFPITSGPTLLSSLCFPSREPKLFERVCARRVKSPAPPSSPSSPPIRRPHQWSCLACFEVKGS